MAQYTVALVAHDHKKAELLSWVEQHLEVMKTCTLVGTGTTGGMIADKTGLEVKRLKSGPLGGDQQIGAMIAEGTLDALFFFWDPLNPAPHDPDVKALLRLCSVWNVPVACTPATADLIVTSPWFNDVSTYQRSVPSFDR